MDEKVVPQSPGAETSTQPTSESFFSKFKNINLPPFVQTFLIPGVVILTILIIGGGGTYFIVSSVLGTNTQSSALSKISEEDIPGIPSSAVSIPTPTLTQTPEATVVSEVTPTSLPSIVDSWPSYNFSAVYITFNYPTGWSVNLGTTSGAPYLYIQNFTGSIPSTYTTGQYSILVSRLEQVGITTISGLTTQLSLNDASSTFINGVNYGTATVLTSQSLSVNGESAYERTVNYSSFPNTNYYELYVLDGLSNVIKFMPLLDTNWGQPYFDLITSSVDFTN